MFRGTSTIRLTALSLLLLCNRCPTEPQERGYLDATQAQIRQRLREPVTGHVEGGSIAGKEGGALPWQPLTITLKLLGSSGFSRGEVFEYEVQIRNASAQPVELPWDLSQADIEPANPSVGYEYQTAAILVGARAGSDRAVTLEGPVLLFGSPSIPSTMMRLEPGDWVRIKAKGRDLSSNPNEPWPAPELVEKQARGTLTATLTLSTSSFAPAPQGNLHGGHEDSRTIAAPVSSSPVAVQFRF